MSKILERIKPQGYQDKIDSSLLDAYFLVNGTQNCMISDEYNIVKRKGYVLLGQAGSLKQGVKSAWTWQTSTNSEIVIRSIYDKFQVLYGGVYRDIATGYKTYSKFRYATWWDRTENKDKLLFVNGETTIKSWSGGMTEIASWTSNTVTKKYAKQSSVLNNFNFDGLNKILTQTNTDFITLGFKVGDKVSIVGTTNNNGIFTLSKVETNKLTFAEQDIITNEIITTDVCVVGVVGRETWRAERFVNFGTKQINIGGTVFTYTGGENTPTLTGLSADPSSVASVGLFVFQPVINNTPAGADLPVGFPIDIMAVNLNQLIFGHSSFRNVYISKQNNFKDVNYTTLVRVAGEGGTIYLDSNLVGIVTSKELTYITAGKSDIYKLEFKPYSDGATAGELLQVTKLETAYGQGAVSHEAFVNAKNGLMYLSNEPTIDFLGQVELIAGQRALPLSDPIKRLLLKIDRTDAQGIYIQNYLIFLFPNANMMLMYDMDRKFWQPPQIVSGSCMSTYQDSLIIHSSITDESYIMFRGLSDNGKPINMKIYTNIDTLGIRSQKKIYDEVFVEALVNNNTNNLSMQILMGLNGATGIHNFSLSYNDDDRFTEVRNRGGGFGTTSFGTSPFGALFSDSDDDIELGDLKLIRKISSNNYQEYFTQQLFAENQEENSYIELICWGSNARITDMSNLDMKE